MGAPLGDTAGHDFQHASNDDAEMPDWDDDDLVAMQAEPMVHPVMPQGMLSQVMLSQVMLHCCQSVSGTCCGPPVFLCWQHKLYSCALVSFV